MAKEGVSLSRAEQLALEQVKFCNLMLQEVRKRNIILKEEFQMAYAKYIGLSTPYEEAIFSLRKVKREFDAFLRVIREEAVKEYDKHFPQSRKERRIRSVKKKELIKEESVGG